MGLCGLGMGLQAMSSDAIGALISLALAVLFLLAVILHVGY